ncbi:MAG: hypothetical protein ACFFBD_18805 [Candidatus Hodarchaeota archaeon]
MVDIRISEEARQALEWLRGYFEIESASEVILTVKKLIMSGSNVNIPLVKLLEFLKDYIPEGLNEFWQKLVNDLITLDYAQEVSQKGD